MRWSRGSMKCWSMHTWDGREWWSNNVLEIELFNTRECNEKFFLKAQQASTVSGRDALEVFYVCVILGFRGLYHNMEADSALAPSLNLPFSLVEWAKQTALAVRLGQGREALSRPTMEIHGAPPLRSRASVVWPWVAAVLTAAAAVLFSDYHADSSLKQQSKSTRWHINLQKRKPLRAIRRPKTNRTTSRKN